MKNCLIVFCFVFCGITIKAKNPYLYKVKSAYVSYFVTNRQAFGDTIAYINYYFENSGRQAYVEFSGKNNTRNNYLIVDSSVYIQKSDSFYYYAKYNNIVNFFFLLMGKKFDFDFYNEVVKYTKYSPKRKFYMGKYMKRYGAFVIPYKSVYGEFLREYKKLPLGMQICYDKAAASNLLNFCWALIPTVIRTKKNEMKSKLLKNYLSMVTR